MTCRVFCILSTLLFSSGLWAYRPAYDVLFRNSGNPIYNGETTTADIQIKEMSSQNAYRIRLQFSKFQKKESLFQAIFDQNFNAEEVLKVSRVINVDVSGISTASNPLAHLFYGLMEMYMANNNKIMLKGLKQFNINLIDSEVSINHEQEKLLQEYLYFSRKKARGRASERENPIRTSDPAKQTVISNVLKESFYNNDQKAKLVRINQRFLWAIEEKNLKAYFDQQTRKLVTMTLPEFDNLTITPADMQVFGAYYSVPKRLVVEEGGVPKFEISILAISNFRDSLDAFQNRAATLQKTAASQNKEKKSVLAQLPSFVLQ